MHPVTSENQFHSTSLYLLCIGSFQSTAWQINLLCFAGTLSPSLDRSCWPKHQTIAPLTNLLCLWHWLILAKLRCDLCRAGQYNLLSSYQRQLARSGKFIFAWHCCIPVHQIQKIVWQFFFNAVLLGRKDRKRGEERLHKEVTKVMYSFFLFFFFLRFLFLFFSVFAWRTHHHIGTAPYSEMYTWSCHVRPGVCFSMFLVFIFF